MTFIALVPSVYYNVKQYGAVGNGVADDTTAINATITAASSGGTVFFPPGTYLISSVITTLYSNLVFMGAGESSILKLANSSNSQMFNSSATLSNVTFRDMVIDGNGSNQSDGAGRDDRCMLLLANISRLQFLNCILQNGRHGAQCRLSVCNYTTIMGCRMLNMGLSGTFQGDNVFIRNSSHYRVIGNTVVGGTNPDTGFAQDGVDHSVVANNTIEAMNAAVTAAMSNTEGASSAASCSYNVISNNAIKGRTGGASTSVGIKVSSYGNTGNGQIHDVMIANNVIDTCDRALWIEQVDRCKMIGNHFANAAGANGQLVLLSTVGTVNDLTIRGNTFSNTFNRAISFDAGSFGGNTIIEDNDFIAVTPAIGGTIPGSAFIRRNPGYNPVGQVTAPGFPATTVAATNTTSSDIKAYIANGTSAITVVQIAGIGGSYVTTGYQIPASGWGIVSLPVGGSVKFTYAAGAPTWTWFGD